ncbi:MAG TPA: phosphodiester glycosidase family protein [Spirochaetia bacterium]|nr:phosphodiester glycosidase family protein [Spirochaetia bacterium]
MSSRRPLKILYRFLILNLVFFILTAPFVIFYGPFPNVKNAVVEAMATSMHYGKYLKYFVSASEFAQLMNNSLTVTTGNSEILPQFNNSHDQSIKLDKINGSRFKGYLLEISDPTRVKIGVAQSLGTDGQTTSEIAKETGAVAAVNAGGFEDPSGTGTGRLPVGVIIQNGDFLAGESLKGPVNLVGLTDQGVLVAGSYTVSQMKNMRVNEGVTFAPPLIVNGKKQITQGDGGAGPGPRTAIGQRKDGTILLLVIDGRQPLYSIGATILDVQNVLYAYGAYNAANLDGGSSTTMYYNGKVINSPADLLGERSIPTAIIVK